IVPPSLEFFSFLLLTPVLSAFPASTKVVTMATDFRGAITKLQWIKREDNIGEALIYGTQNGFIVCCRLKDTVHFLSVSDYTCDSFLLLTPVLSAFPASTPTEERQSSNVAVNQTNGILCVSDPSSSVHLYCLMEGELVKSFLVPTGKTQRIRQVALLDSNRAIVSGSDHGIVYVYTRWDALLTKLHVDPNAWVQKIATADVAGVPTIFVAKSAEVSRRNEVFVYRKTIITLDLIARLGTVLKWMSWTVVILAALAFGYEKVVGPITGLLSTSSDDEIDFLHRAPPPPSPPPAGDAPLHPLPSPPPPQSPIGVAARRAAAGIHRVPAPPRRAPAPAAAPPRRTMAEIFEEIPEDLSDDELLLKSSSALIVGVGNPSTKAE
ncbi:unnamed protein product, partial [Mycena citricolor]